MLTHPKNNPDGTCSTPSCPCHDFAKSEPRHFTALGEVAPLRMAIDNDDQITISEHDLRAAILRVIDDNDYGLWHVFPDVADEARLRFTDAAVRVARQFAEGRG